MASRPTPLHQQIAEELRRQIACGELAPGQPVPSEHDLMQRYGVSRGTVRQARAALRADGTIDGTRGRRFEIRADQLTQPFTELISFSAWAESLGKRPTAQVVESAPRAADHAAASALGLTEGDQIHFLVRLRLVDGEPLMIERTAYPLDIVPMLERIDLTERSIYAQLEREGIIVQSARHHVGAVSAGRTDARLLRIPPGSPLLRVRRVGFSPSGEPLEWAEDRYRADRVEFAIENTVDVQGVDRRLGDRATPGEARCRTR